MQTIHTSDEVGLHIERRRSLDDKRWFPNNMERKAQFRSNPLPTSASRFAALPDFALLIGIFDIALRRDLRLKVRGSHDNQSRPTGPRDLRFAMPFEPGRQITTATPSPLLRGREQGEGCKPSTRPTKSVSILNGNDRWTTNDGFQTKRSQKRGYGLTLSQPLP